MNDRCSFILFYVSEQKNRENIQTDTLLDDPKLPLQFGTLCLTIPDVFSQLQNQGKQPYVLPSFPPPFLSPPSPSFPFPSSFPFSFPCSLLLSLPLSLLITILPP